MNLFLLLFQYLLLQWMDIVAYRRLRYTIELVMIRVWSKFMVQWRYKVSKLAVTPLEDVLQTIAESEIRGNSLPTMKTHRKSDLITFEVRVIDDLLEARMCDAIIFPGPPFRKPGLRYA